MESLATQTLIIFAIRTRKTPFFRSRPSPLLTITSLTVVALGVVLTISPVARALGFTPLPWQFFSRAGRIRRQLPGPVELAKKMFYAEPMSLVESHIAAADAPIASGNAPHAPPHQRRPAPPRRAPTQSVTTLPLMIGRIAVTVFKSTNGSPRGAMALNMIGRSSVVRVGIDTAHLNLAQEADAVTIRSYRPFGERPAAVPTR